MTSSEEASSNSTAAWTEASSLQFIRESLSVFDALGLCPALAGGVLLRGSSNKDLDIQLIPRKDTKVTVDHEFITALETRLGLKFGRSRRWSPGVMLLKFSRPNGQEIDFFVATPHVNLVDGELPPPRLESLTGTRPYIDPRTNRPTRGHPLT